MSRFFSLALLSTLCATPAFAQGLDDLDDDSSGEELDRRGRAKPEVKEIVKGFYAKSSFGGAGYLLDFRGYVNAGSAIGLSFGQDFVDREKTSMAWEVAVVQGVHNGRDYREQADEGCRVAGGAAPCVQGDLRTYSFLANYEFSKYPTRRVGLGIRVGGGALTSPLLMDEEAYIREVVEGEWRGADPGYHTGIKPIGMGGVTFEYYSKLSHFSVGVDADVFYAVGFDLGTNVTGYFKYTF